MRIGVTYDLRSDYRALGYGEEETAEFDAEETIAAICDALMELGHVPERIGGVRALTEKLAQGARWDAVFNICEGLKGVAREAQVPALLENNGWMFPSILVLATVGALCQFGFGTGAGKSSPKAKKPAEKKAPAKDD